MDFSDPFLNPEEAKAEYNAPAVRGRANYLEAWSQGTRLMRVAPYRQ
jgi:hypothetical protein